MSTRLFFCGPKRESRRLGRRVFGLLSFSPVTTTTPSNSLKNYTASSGGDSLAKEALET